MNNPISDVKLKQSMQVPLGWVVVLVISGLIVGASLSALLVQQPIVTSMTTAHQQPADETADIGTVVVRGETMQDYYARPYGESNAQTAAPVAIVEPGETMQDYYARQCAPAVVVQGETMLDYYARQYAPTKEVQNIRPYPFVIRKHQPK